MVADQENRRHREWQWTATGWTRAHRMSLVLMLASVFALVFVDGSEGGMVLASFFTTLCTVGLLFARLFEASLTDLLRGMPPRDCVLYFMLHAVAMVVPGFAGYDGWPVALASLLAFASFTAIDKHGFGRLHAGSLVLVLVVCGAGPLPPIEPLIAYLFFFLLSYRLEHLASRLTRYGEGRGLPVMPAVLQTIVWVVIPWMVVSAVFVWLTPLMAPHTRFLTFEPGAPTAATHIARDISVGKILRDLFILLGLVGLLVYAAWWLERRLGLRRGGRAAAVEEQIPAATSIVRSTGKPAPVPQVELPRDARGRILARFKQLAETIAKDGWGRKRSETAREFIRRLGSELNVEAASLSDAGEAAARIGDLYRACYSELPVGDREAEEFLQWAAATESEVQARATGTDAMP
jgi:hypothetical protein